MRNYFKTVKLAPAEVTGRRCVAHERYFFFDTDNDLEAAKAYANAEICARAEKARLSVYRSDTGYYRRARVIGAPVETVS